MPWFRTLETKGLVYEEKAKAQLQEVEEVKNKLHFEVKSTWYELYELERIINLTNDNLTILKTYESLTLSRYEVAQTSLVDVIRVQLQIVQNENELLALEDKRTPLKVKFNSLLNRDVNSGIENSNTLPRVSSQDYDSQLVDSLFEQIPRLQQLKYQKLSFSRLQKVASLSSKPSFGFGLDYAVVGRRTDMDVPDNGKNIFMPMVSFSLPLNRKKYQASVNEQIINQQKIEYQVENLKNNFITDLENIKKEMIDADRNIELYTSQIQMASQALDILTVNYSSAGKDFEEILRMQQQILRYKIAFEHALKDQYILKSKIEYLLASD
jgi:outer membrane protein TolC